MLQWWEGSQWTPEPNTKTNKKTLGKLKEVGSLSLSNRSLDFLGGSVVKNLSASAGDMGLIPGLGRSPGVQNDKSFQYSCPGNPKDRGEWGATVHGAEGS